MKIFEFSEDTFETFQRKEKKSKKRDTNIKESRRENDNTYIGLNKLKKKTQMLFSSYIQNSHFKSLLRWRTSSRNKY